MNLIKIIVLGKKNNVLLRKGKNTIKLPLKQKTLTDLLLSCHPRVVSSSVTQRMISFSLKKSFKRCLNTSSTFVK